jgi:hypothetical protein
LGRFKQRTTQIILSGRTNVEVPHKALKPDALDSELLQRRV